VSDSRYQRLLEIRQQISKTSTTKFKAYLECADDDDRMRGLLMFNGAGTGRWTAKRVQLQNLPSRGLAIGAEEVPEAIEAAKAGISDLVYDRPLDIAQACIRGMLVPDFGNRFLCADYSAIEGRGLAWLAGEDYVLDAYRADRRMYCVAAAGIYKVPYETILNGRKTDKAYAKMDSVGKVAELACGYQGSLGAFRKMEKSLGVKTDLSDKEIRESVANWRDSRPMTTRLWRGSEHAAFEAVQSPGTVTSYRELKFKRVGKFLMMRLPSGRLLYYFDPQIEPQEMPWTDENGKRVVKDCISVWGVDSQTKSWSKYFLYGGLLTENAVQALSRDIMASALLGLDRKGYHPILTVHDEILCEELLAFGSLDEMIQLMTIVPSWANGFPVAAEGWEGDRYHK
jgi:DNA polymerase